MAGPYTGETVQPHSQASPRVEPPRQMGQGETEEYIVKKGPGRGQKG